MASYIRRVAKRLATLGVSTTPHLTQSNGGVIDFEAAARLPVRTVLSGPSTGVVGAQVIARLAGAEDIITFDMGGTSTDVALLQGGEVRLAREALVHGYPIKAPMLDIHTVGAGGGSIAFVDSGGLLKVSSACSVAMTHAITRSSRLAARDHCMQHGSQPSWKSVACWCRATPASSARWAC